jgi:hypothetical protein
MVLRNRQLVNRLAVALGLALDEIRNPGASLTAGVDIEALCEGVIKEAIGQEGLPQMIRAEMERLGEEA